MHLLTRPSLRAFLLCALLAPTALPHGGSYPGPVDAPPPGGGGGGGAGAPGSGSPSTPMPSGPLTPGPAGPGAPQGGVSAPQSSTGGVDAGPDVTAWQYWWTFNREPYLRLKQRLGESVQSGSDEFFLGRGELIQARDSLRATRERIAKEVVPVLVRMLDAERSNHIQSACMIALARIGDERGEDGLPRTAIGARLVQRLDDANQEVAETAALALGILGDAEHAALLQAVLVDEREVLRAAGVEATSALPMRTRAFAAYGLGQLASRLSYEQREPLVAHLQGALERERAAAQPDVAMAIVAALGLAPLPASPAVEGNSPRSDQIRHLLAVYGDSARPALVRAHVPVALTRLLGDGAADEATLRALLAALCADLGEHGGESGVLEQSAVLALGQLADCGNSPEAVEARALLMRKASGDADEQVRTFAMIALGQAGARPGPDRDWSGLTGRESARTFLMERLESGKVSTRSWSALALAVLERGLDDQGGPGSDAARAALVAGLERARNPEEIGALAIACGLVRDRRASEPLRAALDTLGDAEARGHLCVALGLLGDTGAKPAIQRTIRRSSYQPGLLKSAAIGLGLMGDRDVALDLVELLEGAHSLSSQASISSALGFIGDDRSIRPLMELLGDAQKTDLARAFAAAALGIVGDKDDLPWGSRFSIDVNYRANAATLIDPGGSLGLLNLL
jgi:HEAT repeat protein